MTMRNNNNIRTLRTAVLNVNVISMGFDMAVLVDDHRPEDLLLILRLVVRTTVPIIRGRQTR